MFKCSRRPTSKACVRFGSKISLIYMMSLADTVDRIELSGVDGLLILGPSRLRESVGLGAHTGVRSCMRRCRVPEVLAASYLRKIQAIQL